MGVDSGELWVCHLGEVEYRAGVVLQERLRAARQDDAIPDLLLLLEHPPVYTLGRRSEPRELPMEESWYLDQGIDIVGTDRGGMLTYHGPGQLVGYPIMRIDDVIEFLRRMEAAIVTALADEGVAAEVREGLTGVWAGERKIGSIGLHVSRGVCTHGFAVNVENDLQPFQWVVPCGLEGVEMTSVSREAGERRGLHCFRRRMAYRFAEAHGRRQRVVSRSRIGAVREPAGAVPA